MKDLAQRVRFILNWARRGHPTAYWISGFFFPHGFMTAILQTYARQNTREIDSLSFQFEVLEAYKAEEIAKPPTNGAYVYGLFMENAIWNKEQHCIVDAALGQMSCQMPIIHFKPLYTSPVLLEKRRSVNADEDQVYFKCPVYKTNERAGVLSTTGKSTNFILTVDLPCWPTEEVTIKDTARRSLIQSESEDDMFLIAQNSPEFWTLRGVAMVTMLNE